MIIPIFPLPIAVLPGQRIPLHIFEKRYKLLVQDCFDSKSGVKREFGVNLASAEGLAAIGCTVKVETVLRRFKDGRLHIIVEGKRRFRLHELIEGKSYQCAKVKLLDKSGLAHETKSVSLGDFFELHREMCVVAGVKNSTRMKARFLSYKSAVAVGLDDLQRQTLLELASEVDRLTWLTATYKDILTQVKGQGVMLPVPPKATLLDPGLSQIH